MCSPSENSLAYTYYTAKKNIRKISMTDEKKYRGFLIRMKTSVSFLDRKCTKASRNKISARFRNLTSEYFMG